MSLIQSLIQLHVSAIRRQEMEEFYIPQAVPVLGALVSIPTALYAAVISVATVALWGFKSVSDFFKNTPPDEARLRNKAELLEVSADYGLIFLNNVVTLGIVNNVMVWIVLSSISCCRDDDGY